jgi:CheY-like chemotaxis protein
MMSPEWIQALADLIWPVLAGVVLLALLPTIIQVVKSRAFTIKYANFELSVQDSTEQLRKQIEDLQDQVRALSGQPGLSTPAPRRETLSTLAKGQAPAQGPRAILWVDDRPANNAFEIAKLQRDGLEISTAESTQAALALLESRAEPPALIVSDMGRREGLLVKRTAGLELIREVRSRGLNLPIYIYAGPEAVEKYTQQVLQAGGNGITASPLQLFQFIDQSLAG